MVKANRYQIWLISPRQKIEKCGSWTLWGHEGLIYDKKQNIPKNKPLKITKIGTKWVYNKDYGLILCEDGALPLISLFRPVLDQKP